MQYKGNQSIKYVLLSRMSDTALARSYILDIWQTTFDSLWEELFDHLMMRGGMKGGKTDLKVFSSPSKLQNSI